jgi:hypothetical protein
MALLDTVKEAVGVEPTPIPPPKAIAERIKRSIQRMKDGAPKRNECFSFAAGDQFKYVNGKNELVSQPTTTNWLERRGKPEHRMRTVRNLIFDIIERQVADTTQRVPSYEARASTSDPEDIGAARLAEKVALYGFDKWHIRAATERAVRNAVIAGEGFAWPYFDTSVGPFFTEMEGKTVGQGESAVRVCSGNEVAWAPGVSGEDSRYHVVQQARDRESVMELEGYLGGSLKPDASTSDVQNEDVQDSKLVLVTDYLERPCPAYPMGRWLTLANGRVIVPERPYPCTDGDGDPLNEPVLHKLSYAQNPATDRDDGLVKHLLDPQRAANNSVNKFIEWIVMTLNPQFIIMNGSLQKGQRRNDEPGTVYNAFGSAVQIIQPGAVPPELMEFKNDAEADMARIAAQNDIPSNVEAGKAIQALIERDQSRKANFIGNLSDFHSRLMRHCLYLVQKHYTEERLIKVRGRGFDPGSLQDFEGSQLRGQVDVRVYPDSIEPQTREGQTQKIQNIVAMFPGAFSPDVVISAMENGTAGTLIKGFELAQQRVATIIQKARDGTLIDEPNRPVFPNEDAGPQIDPVTGRPVPQENPDGTPVMAPGEPDPMTGMPGPPQVQFVQATEVPGWMPRPFDNIPIHKKMMEDWMQTADFDSLAPPEVEQAMLYYSALLDLEAKKAQRDAELQNQMAASQGLNNAAAPQTKLPPSLPAVGNGKPS